MKDVNINNKRVVTERYKFEKVVNSFVDNKRKDLPTLKFLNIKELTSLLESVREAKYKDETTATSALYAHLARINNRNNYYQFKKLGHGINAKIYFEINENSSRYIKESIPNVKEEDLPIGYCPMSGEKRTSRDIECSSRSGLEVIDTLEELSTINNNNTSTQHISVYISDFTLLTRKDDPDCYVFDNYISITLKSNKNFTLGSNIVFNIKDFTYNKNGEEIFNSIKKCIVLPKGYTIVNYVFIPPHSSSINVKNMNVYRYTVYVEDSMFPYDIKCILNSKENNDPSQLQLSDFCNGYYNPDDINISIIDGSSDVLNMYVNNYTYQMIKYNNTHNIIKEVPVEVIKEVPFKNDCILDQYNMILYSYCFNWAVYNTKNEKEMNSFFDTLDKVFLLPDGRSKKFFYEDMTIPKTESFFSRLCVAYDDNDIIIDPKSNSGKFISLYIQRINNDSYLKEDHNMIKLSLGILSDNMRNRILQGFSKDIILEHYRSFIGDEYDSSIIDKAYENQINLINDEIKTINRNFIKKLNSLSIKKANRIKDISISKELRLKEYELYKNSLSFDEVIEIFPLQINGPNPELLDKIKLSDKFIDEYFNYSSKRILVNA